MWDKIANSGDLYDCNDKELLAYQAELVNRLREYNLTPETLDGLKQRELLLKEICGTYGENLIILPPVFANFGLKHVHFGRDVFVNFNATFVDDANIYIGEGTLIGPSVNIATPLHPISPRLRRHALQYNKQVHIGKNVWICANATILPGVTIGDNSVIGAGSVVTKDIPSNVVAFGNPATVVRKITKEDDKFFSGKPIPQEILDKYLN